MGPCARMSTCTVHFLPDNKKISVERETTLLSAALSAGLYINSSCGGEGVCGRCKVIVRSGPVSAHATGALSPKERSGGMVLACATTVLGDCLIEIPPESRLSLDGLTQEEIRKRLGSVFTAPEDVETAAWRPGAPFALEPLVQKRFVRLPEPNLNDRVSDLERLERELARELSSPIAYAPLATLKSLGELLRKSDWQVTAAVGRDGAFAELVTVEPADTSPRNKGVCFDIGTTTVTAQLVDLTKGTVLGTKATYNKQAAFGSDVITRIIYAKDADGLQVLHRAVVEDMNEMVRTLAHEQGVDLNDITAAVCAGNTTMTHLLLRVDPTYIRREPYVPTFNAVSLLRSSEIELRINPRGLVAFIPGVASYVGGDIVAGILSSRLYEQEGLSALIDIGTNGEIAIGNREFIISAAASAGPAFEGSGVSCGMRAGNGAIQRVAFSAKAERPQVECIGQGAPSGICGSGYISLISQMLRSGFLDKDGKICPHPGGRVRERDGIKEFVVLFEGEEGAVRDVVITEADIENLKRAKAAIYAATASLLKHLGVGAASLQRLFIAGGFGTFLDVEEAVRIGLLPDIERSRIVFIGNSSLAGAREVLLSQKALGLSRELARRTTYVELSVERGYMDEYMAALFFPHTDLDLFPSFYGARS